MTDPQTPNILIVGKEAALSRHVHRSLAHQEYRYVCVASAEEAVSATRKVGVDAALIDMASIGEPAGLDLAASLRREVRNLPIVVLTNAPALAVAIEAMRLGATDCLREPVTSDELRTAVERAVRWRRNAVGQAGGCERLAREMSDRSTALVRACAESGIG
jgi:two-component system KDP operon response regulator KdpE